jgi:hypothetical protein
LGQDHGTRIIHSLDVNCLPSHIRDPLVAE